MVPRGPLISITAPVHHYVLNTVFIVFDFGLSTPEEGIEMAYAVSGCKLSYHPPKRYFLESCDSVINYQDHHS